ncbi:MAG TPA: hypothetical protein DCG14_06740, partial [Phycisphaerales bacterium]|nr:hypothetical protein [Phycisphaerales bacterium]
MAFRRSGSLRTMVAIGASKWITTLADVSLVSGMWGSMTKSATFVAVGEPATGCRGIHRTITTIRRV